MNRKESSTANILTALAAILIATAVSGCGQTAYHEIPEDEWDVGSDDGSYTPPGGSNPGTGGTVPALSYSFTITGSGGTTPSRTFSGIRTDSILRVKVRAQPAGNLSLSTGSYSNYNGSYGCVAYQITVGGRTVTTQPLKIPGSFSPVSSCQNAPSEQVIDFSDRITSNVQITVSNPRYDYYCNLYMSGAMGYAYPYGSLYQTYCSAGLYTVYRNHTVNGDLEVFVNGS